MARGLVFRIVEHAFEEGWLHENDVVVDPFFGIGSTALPCLLRGVNVIGCELESRFVDLSKQNLAYWRRKYGEALRGTATVIQGDSRRLSEIVEQAGLLVSSPPFSGIVATQDPNFLTPGEQGKLIPSKSNQADYGHTPGNLGNLRADEAGFAEAMISSPPFCDGGMGDKRKKGGIHDNTFRVGAKGQVSGTNYGSSPGQLGNMKPGDLDAAISSQEASAVISSPPYEGCDPNEGRPSKSDGRYIFKIGSQLDGYAYESDNIGNSQGDSFWAASKQIILEVHKVLKPGGHAIFVVKDFIRSKARVPFADNWKSLCESCGFELVHWHNASLVERKGVQITLDGEAKELKTERMSFFRRLHVRKYPHLKIEEEVVLCMRRIP